MEKNPFNQQLNILPCGYLVTTKEGEILFANKFFHKLLHTKEVDVIKKKFIQDFLPIKLHIDFETHIRTLTLMQGAVEEISLQLIRNDKLQIPVLMNAVLVKNEQNYADTIHYSFFDISRWKKHEFEILDANKKQEQLITELKFVNENYQNLTGVLEEKKSKYKKLSEVYRQISEVSRVGGWEIDLVTGKIRWSIVAKKIHEVEKDFEPNLSTFIKWYKGNAIYSAIENAIKTGEPYDVELKLTTAKSNEVWVRVKGYAEQTTDKNTTILSKFRHLVNPDAPQKTIRLYGIFQDIDKQKNMMLQLLQNNVKIKNDNAYYKSIIENNSFYIIKTDLSGRYIYLNPFFCKLQGVKPEDRLGKNALDFISNEDTEVFTDTIKRCFEHPNQPQWIILTLPLASDVKFTQWEIKLITDEHGNHIELLYIGYDISTLIKKQKELQVLADVTAEQNKRLVNFTYIISHNIRSHVANLMGLIDFIDKEGEDEKTMGYDLIKVSINNLDATIRALNEVISIQTHTNLPVSNLSIRHEIDSVVQSIQEIVNHSDTTINYQFDETEEVSTNQAYFESIVLNLLTNAIKYKSPDRAPIIDIGLRTIDNYKLLLFKDNGLGIDLKKYQTRLFGMYNTFHGNKDAKGMGLFIVKTQVEAMNGKIEVESEVGSGTKFSIYFYDN